MLLLGLDLGTTNAKVAAFDLQGRVHAEAAVGYPTHFPRPGWAEQRVSDWTTSLAAATHEVVTQLGTHVHDLVGAGLSAQGPGLVLVDADGTPLLDTSPTWQDERCAPEGKWLYERTGSIAPGLGGPFTNFPAKLLWAQQNQSQAAAQARYAMGIKDYLAFWLTGIAATEPSSNAGGTEWHAKTFAASGWPLNRLPPILRSTDVVGPIRAPLGLPKLLPLVIGLNDGAAATLATGALAPGDAIITLATNGVLRVIMESAVTPETRLGHSLFNWPYLPPDRWIVGGQTKAGASALHWFAGAVDLPIDALLAQAEQSEIGSGGVVILPYLLGRGSPYADADATGTFLGLRHSTRHGDLARAVLEGSAFALRDIRDDFGAAPGGVRMSGGGGRSALWRQIVADVLGQELTWHGSDSTLGAAIVAAVGLGLHADFPAATAAMVRATATHAPIPANVARYDSAYAAFQRARDALAPAATARSVPAPRPP